MIVARNFTELSEQEFRALLHCAQYAIEQLTKRPVYRDGTLPAPSAAVIGHALKGLQLAKKESR
jgi:hypothetical protein